MSVCLTANWPPLPLPMRTSHTLSNCGETGLLWDSSIKLDTVVSWMTRLLNQICIWPDLTWHSERQLIQSSHKSTFRNLPDGWNVQFHWNIPTESLGVDKIFETPLSINWYNLQSGKSPQFSHLASMVSTKHCNLQQRTNCRDGVLSDFH